MKMGQVWPKADFDGIDAAGHHGGRGSVLAVTGQNPGVDGRFNTADDVLAPLNVTPIPVSIDATVGNDCHDGNDRVRSFYSFHSGGAHFLYSDGSVHFVEETISAAVYRAMSTIAGGEATP